MKYTNEEFLRLVKERKPNIQIVGAIPKDSETPMECVCTVCGYHSQQSKRGLLHNNGRCPVCDGKIVLEGFNDLFSKAPDIARHYSEEFAKTHTCKSSIKGKAKCPNCGFEKKISPNTINRQGFGCTVCGDGISYPNKFVRNFLLQLPIENVRFEYSPKWVGKRFYDNYFEYQGRKYIVEVDGGLGHSGKAYHNEVNLTTILRDNEKLNLAIQHGIEVIRIDAKISDADYILNNIKNSRLNELFDLSSIDWHKCNVMANKSLLYEVCREYHPNKEMTIQEVADKFGISVSCATVYLRRGAKLGFGEYDIKEVRKRGRLYSSKRQGRKVRVYDKNDVEIGVFESVKLCGIKLSEIYQMDFKLNSMNSSILANRRYKGFKILLCE